MTWRNMTPEELELEFNPRATAPRRGRPRRRLRRRVGRDASAARSRAGRSLRVRREGNARHLPHGRSERTGPPVHPRRLLAGDGQEQLQLYRRCLPRGRGDHGARQLRPLPDRDPRHHRRPDHALHRLDLPQRRAVRGGPEPPVRLRQLGRRTPHRDGPRARLGGRGPARRHHQGRHPRHRCLRLRAGARHHGERAGPPRPGDGETAEPGSATRRAVRCPSWSRWAGPSRGSGSGCRRTTQLSAASMAWNASTWSCPATTTSTSPGPSAMPKARSRRRCCG